MIKASGTKINRAYGFAFSAFIELEICFFVLC